MCSCSTACFGCVSAFIVALLQSVTNRAFHTSRPLVVEFELCIEHSPLAGVNQLFPYRVVKKFLNGIHFFIRGICTVQTQSNKLVTFGHFADVFFIQSKLQIYTLLCMFLERTHTDMEKTQKGPWRPGNLNQESCYFEARVLTNCTTYTN